MKLLNTKWVVCLYNYIPLLHTLKYSTYNLHYSHSKKKTLATLQRLMTGISALVMKILKTETLLSVICII